MIVIQAIANPFFDTGVKCSLIQKKITYSLAINFHQKKKLNIHRYYLINRYFVCNLEMIKTIELIWNINIA